LQVLCNYLCFFDNNVWCFFRSLFIGGNIVAAVFVPMEIKNLIDENKVLKAKISELTPKE